MKPIFSVVVPTKNRYHYLYFLIQSIERLNSEEVELVIQDNSDDNNEFLEFLKYNKKPFIKYNYIKGQISMSENSDKAILNSTGEYVSFLGDDDGLTKYTLDCVRWMKKSNIDIVKPAEVSYFWPDANSGLARNVDSATIVYKAFSKDLIIKNAKKELLEVLNNGVVNRGQMPLVYHSIVSRRVLDKIYDKCNTYFPGNSPDISNAVALSLVVDEFISIPLPLTYSGCSVFHGGGVTAPGKMYPPMIEDIPWFRKDAEEKWDEHLPKIAVGSLIWADSAIAALKKMQRDDLISLINFNKTYLNFIMMHPKQKFMVMGFCNDRRHIKFLYWWSLFCKYNSALWRRFGWYIGVIKKAQKVRGIQNIIEASEYLETLTAEKAQKLFLSTH